MHKFLLLLFALSPFYTWAQEIGPLISAVEYHRMPNGPAKTEKVMALERNGWFHQDTYYDMKGKVTESPKVDLSPYVDDTGETVFLVTDVSPEFPGGATVWSDYLQNALGDILTKPDDEVQASVPIRFYVEKDGRISGVGTAQEIMPWISTEAINRCIRALEEMPKWTPGAYKGKPVKVKMLMVFSLR